ncbi:MAG: tRNA (5-methylaminomethyl-2-thiouridine)(34)-methyltransferase MnmD [Prevotellaceae bacterium]|jgi:tRNA U34 5-methylaminomethyl-2-thiouridine-forming methyltransferase MnmC|nr:tRNA (5-methylaminomethyl-2-thiouridine)(34)-methyltransferase MnmD [Prevotellaceae bacterium]
MISANQPVNPGIVSVENSNKLLTTSDGSSTLLNSNTGETYHSMEGAVMESKHVYVSPTFDTFKNREKINILEVGFGTGLNTLITFLESGKSNIAVYYETLEPYPIPESAWSTLNYPCILGGEEQFSGFHKCKYDTFVEYQHFVFVKRCCKIEDFVSDNHFDAVYFDAFSPNVQPEMWTVEIFNKIYQLLNNKGILLTYSAKGIVKKALRNAGFKVVRLNGAGHKHHMLKAIKHEIITDF